MCCKIHYVINFETLSLDIIFLKSIMYIFRFIRLALMNNIPLMIYEVHFAKYSKSMAEATLLNSLMRRLIYSSIHHQTNSIPQDYCMNMFMFQLFYQAPYLFFHISKLGYSRVWSYEPKRVQWLFHFIYACVFQFQ